MRVGALHSSLTKVRSFLKEAFDYLKLFAGWIADLSGMVRYLCAFLAGAATSLAFAPIHFVPALLVGFSLFVWLLDGVSRSARPLNQALKTGWWFGFGYHLFGLYWIGFAFMVDAATFGWMMPFAVVLMPAGLALFSAAAAALAVRLWASGGIRILALTLAWALAEWLRGHILTGFPWNLPAYVWGQDLAIAQSASFLGAYGLSLVTLFWATVPAGLVSLDGKGRSRRWDLGIVLTALSLLLIFSVTGGMKLNTNARQTVDGVTLRLVQPSVPQKEKWKPKNRSKIMETYFELSTSQAGPEGEPTHIIWPEAALPLFLSAHPEVQEAISDVLKQDQLLITGSPRYRRAPDGGKTKFFNSLHVLSSQGEIISTYDKYHLVPFGEYLPLEPILGAIGLKKLTAGAGGYTPGPGPRTIEVQGAGLFTPLICYEAIFPGRQPPGSRPSWLLNVTNDAWYGNTSGPRQHLVQSQFRAIEQGLPLVRSANTGISAVIDGQGVIWSRLDLNENGVLDSALPAPLPPTLYSQIGDLLFWILISVVAAITLVHLPASPTKPN
jgi:apolipoprotein N-acyltransferase